MNYIDIAFLVLVVIMIIVGAKRGFLVSMLNVLKYIVAVPVAYYASVSYNEPIYDRYLKEYAQKAVEEKLSNAQSLNEFINSLKERAEFLSSVFPDCSDLSNLDKLSGDNLSEYICIDIIRPLALIAVSIVVFLAVLVLILVVADIIIRIFKKHRKKSIEENSKGMLVLTNGLLGALFAIIKSVILLFVVCMLLEYAAGLAGSETSFYHLVESSRVIEFVNEYNPLV